VEGGGGRKGQKERGEEFTKRCNAGQSLRHKWSVPTV